MPAITAKGPENSARTPNVYAAATNEKPPKATISRLNQERRNPRNARHAPSGRPKCKTEAPGQRPSPRKRCCERDWNYPAGSFQQKGQQELGENQHKYQRQVRVLGLKRGLVRSFSIHWNLSLGHIACRRNRVTRLRCASKKLAVTSCRINNFIRINNFDTDCLSWAGLHASRRLTFRKAAVAHVALSGQYPSFPNTSGRHKGTSAHNIDNRCTDHPDGEQFQCLHPFRMRERDNHSNNLGPHSGDMPSLLSECRNYYHRIHGSCPHRAKSHPRQGHWRR